MPEAKSTKERLSDELRLIGQPRLARRASAGAYDDFQSDSATPLSDLVRDLYKVGTIAAALLAERAKKGEFDGTAEEAEAWASSPEGKAIMADLKGKP